MPGDGCRLDRRDLRTAAERASTEPRCPRGLCPDLRAGPPNRPARLPPVRAGYGGRRALPRRGRFRRRPTGRTPRDVLRAAVTPIGPGRLRDLSPPPDAAGEDRGARGIGAYGFEWRRRAVPVAPRSALGPNGLPVVAAVDRAPAWGRAGLPELPLTRAGSLHGSGRATGAAHRRPGGLGVRPRALGRGRAPARRSPGTGRPPRSPGRWPRGAARGRGTSRAGRLLETLARRAGERQDRKRHV